MSVQVPIFVAEKSVMQRGDLRRNGRSATYNQGGIGNFAVFLHREGVYIIQRNRQFLTQPASEGTVGRGLSAGASDYSCPSFLSSPVTLSLTLQPSTRFPVFQAITHDTY